MSELGPLRYFRGIEISSTSDGFFISQEKYIQDLIAHAALGDGRMVATTMDLNVHLHAYDDDPLTLHDDLTSFMGSACSSTLRPIQ